DTYDLADPGEMTFAAKPLLWLTTDAVRGCPSFPELFVELLFLRPPVTTVELEQLSLRKRLAGRDAHTSQTRKPETHPVPQFRPFLHRFDKLCGADALGLLHLRRAQGRRGDYGAVQIHLRIEELFQRADVCALLRDVFVQSADPDLCGDDCGWADRRRASEWHAPYDLHPSGLSGFAPAFEIPGRRFLYLVVGGFLYRPESVGGFVLRRLGRSAAVSGRAQPGR